MGRERVLQDFITDRRRRRHRGVSWIVAPYLWSEHPAAAPDWGALIGERPRVVVPATWTSAAPVGKGQQTVVQWPADADGN